MSMARPMSLSSWERGGFGLAWEVLRQCHERVDTIFAGVGPRSAIGGLMGSEREKLRRMWVFTKHIKYHGTIEKPL